MVIVCHWNSNADTTMRILVFLACASLALAFNPRSPHRLQSRSLIVGGVEAPAGSRPYQVGLFSSPSPFSQFCGGTLVHEQWVITAAHCYGGESEVYVGLGFHNLGDAGNEVIKGSWIVHRAFEYDTLNRDVALIRLGTPATLSDKVAKITIASSEVASGTDLLVSGWGALAEGGDLPDELRQVVVTSISKSACRNDYIGEPITKYMFCAKADGKDSCQGDSGGPIVSHYDESKHVDGVVLEGIVSWGFGCADPSYPGVYTQVSRFCNWIKRKTSSDVICGQV